MHAEEAAVPDTEVRRSSRKLTGSERLAVPADEEDGAHLGQGVDDSLEATMQARLIAPNRLVRHVAHDLLDFGNGSLDRLEHLERWLVLYVKVTVYAFVGNG